MHFSRCLHARVFLLPLTTASYRFYRQVYDGKAPVNLPENYGALIVQSGGFAEVEIDIGVDSLLLLFNPWYMLNPTGIPRAQVPHRRDAPPGPSPQHFICYLPRISARSSERPVRPESQVGYRCGMIGTDATALKRADVGFAVQVYFAAIRSEILCFIDVE